MYSPDIDKAPTVGKIYISARLQAMLLSLLVALAIACRFEAVDALHGVDDSLRAASAVPLPVSQRSILATASEGDIICPDRVTPAKLCIDTPNACATTLCPPDRICKAVSCPSPDGKSTECIPVCVQKDFTPTPGKCPANYPEVQCTVTGVCNLACARGKTCVSNTCGNCSALCVDANDLQCVDGAPINCFLDPCLTKNCTAGRKCVSEYCGGCNAGCVLNKPCPNGKPRRACLKTANRCLVARCGFESTCVPDQCNDCAAVCVPPCPPGQYVNEDTARCTRCPVGYYCPGGTGTTAPIPCNSGTYADKPGLDKCKVCPSGTTTPAKPKRKGFRKCRPVP